MNTRSQKLLEEYTRMMRQAEAHVGSADNQALRVFLKKIEVHALHEYAQGAHRGTGVRARTRNGKKSAHAVVRAAASIDRILQTRLTQGGGLGDWDEHISRVRAILGPWPP